MLPAIQFTSTVHVVLFVGHNDMLCFEVKKTCQAIVFWILLRSLPLFLTLYTAFLFIAEEGEQVELADGPGIILIKNKHLFGVSNTINAGFIEING